MPGAGSHAGRGGPPRGADVVVVGAGIVGAAIKLSMDMVGRYGGPCRPPRGPLSPENERRVRAETRRAIDALEKYLLTAA
jgi:dihydrodipicolinate synthase/N-acetylneuraminate lyase